MSRSHQIRILTFAFAFLLLCGLLFGLIAYYLQEADPGASPPPTETPAVIPTQTFCCSLVNLAWFYKPPADGNLQPLAEHFDTFILTKNDESTRDQLRNLGVTGPILQYLRFDAIHDPGSCRKRPFQNQVAFQEGEFCQISENHPDWFLLDQQGQRMYNDSGYVMMDPGNSEWRGYWLSQVQAMQSRWGWQGVFLDNVEASLSKRKRLNQIPAKYPTNSSYQAAIEGFLAFISNAYFRPQGHPLFANIIAVEEDQVWLRYLNHLDGVMEEAWAVDWDNGYRSYQSWLADLLLAEQVQASGRQIILVSQGAYSDVQRQQFAFASYLLVSWGRAAFRYADSARYKETWLYNNYQIDLGTPLGARYFEDNLWKRDFSRGRVIVDAQNHTAVIQSP